MAKSIDIPINIELGITKETAELCVRLVNLFLENNPGWMVATTRSAEVDHLPTTQINLVYDPLFSGTEEHYE